MSNVLTYYENWFFENKKILNVNTIEELKNKYESMKNELLCIRLDNDKQIKIGNAIYYKKHGVETLLKIINNKIPTQYGTYGSEFLQIITIFRMVQELMLLKYNSNTFVMIVGGINRDLISNSKYPKDLDLAIVGDYMNFHMHLHCIMNLLGYNVNKPEQQKDKHGGRTTTIWTMSFQSLLYEFAPLRESEKYNDRGILIETTLRKSEGFINTHITEELSQCLVNDSKRRDFTVNTLGLFYNPIEGYILYSPILYNNDALNDVEKMILRRVAINSFTDDSSRILRLISFMIRGYNIEESFSITDEEKNALRSLLLQRAQGTIDSFFGLNETAVSVLRIMIDKRIDILKPLCYHNNVWRFFKTKKNIYNIDMYLKDNLQQPQINMFDKIDELCHFIKSIVKDNVFIKIIENDIYVETYNMKNIKIVESVYNNDEIYNDIMLYNCNTHIPDNYINILIKMIDCEHNVIRDTTDDIILMIEKSRRQTKILLDINIYLQTYKLGCIKNKEQLNSIVLYLETGKNTKHNIEQPILELYNSDIYCVISQLKMFQNDIIMCNNIKFEEIENVDIIRKQNCDIYKAQHENKPYHLFLLLLEYVLLDKNRIRNIVCGLGLHNEKIKNVYNTREHTFFRKEKELILQKLGLI